MTLIGLLLGLVGSLFGIVVGLAGGMVGLLVGLCGALVPLAPFVLVVLFVVLLVTPPATNARTASGPQRR